MEVRDQMGTRTIALPMSLQHPARLDPLCVVFEFCSEHNFEPLDVCIEPLMAVLNAHYQDKFVLSDWDDNDASGDSLDSLSGSTTCGQQTQLVRQLALNLSSAVTQEEAIQLLTDSSVDTKCLLSINLESNLHVLTSVACCVRVWLHEILHESNASPSYVSLMQDEQDSLPFPLQNRTARRNSHRPLLLLHVLKTGGTSITDLIKRSMVDHKDWSAKPGRRITWSKQRIEHCFHDNFYPYLDSNKTKTEMKTASQAPQSFPFNRKAEMSWDSSFWRDCSFLETTAADWSLGDGFQVQPGS